MVTKRLKIPHARYISDVNTSALFQRTITFLNFKDSISKIKIQENDYTP